METVFWKNSSKPYRWVQRERRRRNPEPVEYLLLIHTIRGEDTREAAPMPSIASRKRYDQDVDDYLDED